MYFYPPHETANLTYTVRINPAPADSAVAVFHKREKTGEVFKEEQIQKQGSNNPLSLALSDHTIADSPIWIECTFEKADAAPAQVICYGVISLAEPGVYEIEAPETAKVGETVEVKVKTWAALAYDLPDLPTLFEEDEPDRIPSDKKAETCWTARGVDLDDQGESIQLEIKEEDRGTRIRLQAWIGNQERRAEAEIVVPGQRIKIRLESDEGVLADTDYKLEVGDETFEGKTDADGYLRHGVSDDAREGELTFWHDDEEYVFPIHVPDHVE